MHVLTGPDHLSAIATLSANVRWSQAFWLGVRWGVGHSAGLLLVGIILIAITVGTTDETIHINEGVSIFFESLVGVFMLSLGVYGIKRAWDRRPKEFGNVNEVTSSAFELTTDIEIAGLAGLPPSYHSHAGILHVSRPSGSGTHSQSVGSARVCRSQTLASGFTTYSSITDSDYRGDQAIQVEIDALEAPQPIISDEDSAGRGGGHALEAPQSSPTAHRMVVSEVPVDQEDVTPNSVVNGNGFQRLWSRLSTGTVALCAGLIHGLAGPGGVLGVIPAIELHNWRLASLYLGVFCICSTLTMGVFALLYGLFSSRLGRASRWQFKVECISACFSIVIGLLWLTLLAVGKLDVVFP